MEVNVTAITCSAATPQAAQDNGPACYNEETPDKPVI